MDIFDFPGTYAGVVFDPHAPQDFWGSIRVDILDTTIEVYYLPTTRSVQKHTIPKEDVRPIPIEDMQSELENASFPSEIPPECFQLGTCGKMLFWEKPASDKACMTVRPTSGECRTGILFGPSEEQKAIFRQMIQHLEEELSQKITQI
jgi:hypothetical protein